MSHERRNGSVGATQRGWANPLAQAGLLSLLVVSELFCVEPDARPGLPSTASGAGGSSGTGGASGVTSSSSGTGGSGSSASSSGGGVGGGAVALTPKIDWAVQIGGQSIQIARALDVAASGDAVVGGDFFGSSLDIGDKQIDGGGNFDVFVAELSKQDGKTLWARSLGGSGDQRLGDLAADPVGSNYIVLTGTFWETVEADGCSPITATGLDSDIFVAHLDAGDGKCQWIKAFAGNTPDDQSSLRIALSPQGNIAVAGMFKGNLDFGGNAKPIDAIDIVTESNDVTIFTALLNPSGDAIFSRVVGVTVDPGFSDNNLDLDIAFDKDENVIVTGSYDYELEITAGAMQNSNGGEWFAIKLDGKSGMPLLELHSAESDGKSRSGLSVVPQPSGDLAFTGLFSGALTVGASALLSGLDNDIGLLIFDANGMPKWSKAIGGAGTQRAYSLSQDAGGNFLMGGSFNGVLDFSEAGTLVGTGTMADQNRDLFFAKLSPQGSLIWAMQAGDTGPQNCVDIRAGKNGESFAIGTFGGAIQLGSNTLDNTTDNNDVYVVRLSDQPL